MRANTRIGTIVPPPLLRSLRSNPAEAVKLQWARFKTRIVDAARIAGAWFASKPSYLKGARLSIKRASIVPTAKALHRAMSEALAAGDRDTLRRICAPTLYESLSARLAQRPKGRHFEWSLVQYTNPLQFPRIVDHKMVTLPAGPGGQITLVHQVVVAISSRQRLVQYDANRGQPTPVSEKVHDLVENMILTRTIEMKSYQAGDWAVLGQAEETTYQHIAAEERLINSSIGL